MKKIVNDLRIMLKVCDMYYKQDLNQEDIAQRLGLSRPTVSRILKNARADGLVQIDIFPPGEIHYFELERAIERQYGLKDVIIIKEDPSLDVQKREVGKATAQFLMRVVKNNNIIGVSMGTTLTHIAPFLSPGSGPNLTFIPLVGGMGQLGMEVHCNQIVADLARASHGKFMLMHAPAMVSDQRIKDNLMQDAYISKVLDMTRKLDVALVGIGVPTSESTVIATGYYSAEDVRQLRENNVAGDVCMHFYDINGNTDCFTVNNNVCGMDINDLRHTPYSIGVATGVSKINAIIGAINGRYINVLITDAACAQQLYANKQEAPLEGL